MAHKFTYSKDVSKIEGVEKKPAVLLNCDCEVWGCNLVGSIQTDGRWNCRYHWGKGGEQLASITLVIKNHPVQVRYLEKLYSLKPYDFDVPEACKTAPYGMGREEGETFTAYRDRVQKKLFSCAVTEHV